MILCGEPGMVPLVQQMHPDARVEVREFDRLQPLQVAKKPLRQLKELCAGDAVIAFSRQAIYETKQAIERATGQQCAVIYGRLPIENRIAQARLFNEASFASPAILVASDAIGMGLNLYNI